MPGQYRRPVGEVLENRGGQRWSRPSHDHSGSRIRRGAAVGGTGGCGQRRTTLMGSSALSMVNSAPTGTSNAYTNQAGLRRRLKAVRRLPSVDTSAPSQFDPSLARNRIEPAWLVEPLLHAQCNCPSLLWAVTRKHVRSLVPSSLKTGCQVEGAVDIQRAELAGQYSEAIRVRSVPRRRPDVRPSPAGLRLPTDKKTQPTMRRFTMTPLPTRTELGALLAGQVGLEFGRTQTKTNTSVMRRLGYARQAAACSGRPQL